MNLSSAVRTAKSIITANSPVLLVGTAVAGVVATGVLAAKGGYKARGLVDEARMKSVPSPIGPFDTFHEYYETFLESTPELSMQEVAKLTWSCYAAPVATGASTIAATAGVHLIHTKRHAALAGLYAMTASKLDDYSDKAEELLGSKKTQQLNNELGQKAVDKAPVDNHEVIILEGGTELMYDELSGRYFMASVPIVEHAMSEINLELAESGESSLNDFYSYAGLSHIPLGNQLGWGGKPGIRVSTRFGAVTTPDGRSAVSVSFHEAPKMDYKAKR